MTVCVDQHYDRWGFARMVLDAVKYECDEFPEEESQDWDGDVEYDDWKE